MLLGRPATEPHLSPIEHPARQGPRFPPGTLGSGKGSPAEVPYGRQAAAARHIPAQLHELCSQLDQGDSGLGPPGLRARCP